VNNFAPFVKLIGGKSADCSELPPQSGSQRFPRSTKRSRPREMTNDEVREIQLSLGQTRIRGGRCIAWIVGRSFWPPTKDTAAKMAALQFSCADAMRRPKIALPTLFLRERRAYDSTAARGCFSSFEHLTFLRHSSFGLLERNGSKGLLRHFGYSSSKLCCQGASNRSARAGSAAMASIVARGAINDGSIFSALAA
jgi:hypothetical protein